MQRYIWCTRPFQKEHTHTNDSVKNNGGIATGSRTICFGIIKSKQIQFSLIYTIWDCDLLNHRSVADWVLFFTENDMLCIVYVCHSFLCTEDHKAYVCAEYTTKSITTKSTIQKMKIKKAVICGCYCSLRFCGVVGIPLAASYTNQQYWECHIVSCLHSVFFFVSSLSLYSLFSFTFYSFQ